jgi:hypothetical protein
MMLKEMMSKIAYLLLVALVVFLICIFWPYGQVSALIKHL